MVNRITIPLYDALNFKKTKTLLFLAFSIKGCNSMQPKKYKMVLVIRTLGKGVKKKSRQCGVYKSQNLFLKEYNFKF